MRETLKAKTPARMLALLESRRSVSADFSPDVD